MFLSLTANRQALFLSREIQIDWYSRHNHYYSPGGIPYVLGKCVVQQHGRCRDEQRRHKRISPGSVGTRRIGLLAAQNEYRAGCGHVEQPLGEDRQREKLAEATREQQQDNRKHKLDNESD